MLLHEMRISLLWKQDEDCPDGVGLLWRTKDLY
jgi:hypothetical protein